MPKTPLTLIKLGGSVITNKEVPMMVRPSVLKRLVKEIAAAAKKTEGQVIVGHGQGSFAHAPALRYKTIEGFVSEDSRMGMAITQDSAAQLNRIVVNQFLAEQIPAVSFQYANSMVTKDKTSHLWCGGVLEEYLAKGLQPVTCGDVLVDANIGCTIWSTEKIFMHLCEYFADHAEYQVNRVVHVTEVDGVLDSHKKVIERITPENLAEVKKAITVTKGFDVTGGMLSKILDSLDMTTHGMDVQIVSGMKADNLYNCLVGLPFVGTTITQN